MILGEKDDFLKKKKKKWILAWTVLVPSALSIFFLYFMLLMVGVLHFEGDLKNSNL